MTQLAEQVAAALARVPAASGRHAAPRITDGNVAVILDASGLTGEARAALEASVREAVGAVPGVGAVRIAMTQAKPARRIIAVASGKGGVGKSTVAANLAVALHRAGHAVGLVDADIYGPSQPRLLGTEGQRPVAVDQKLQPIAGPDGLPMLSMGHLVAAGQAVAWRGPMVAGAVGQLLDADWGAVQTLIADLPPGTGDVQLTLIQKYRPAGAVIVTTPQDLALIDATRAIDLFAQAGVPIIGIIENMAGYHCPHCGALSEPFGSGGGEREAAARGVPLLARIPLSMAVRAASDAGTPPAAGNGPEGAAFVEAARALLAWLETHHAADV